LRNHDKHRSPNRPRANHRVAPVPITARDIGEIVQYVLAKDDPKFFSDLLAALPNRRREHPCDPPPLVRAYARATSILARLLADRALKP
jgi:hypothetical protein